MIKHGEIGEDSKAAPQKLVYQPLAKYQVPQTPHFVVLVVGGLKGHLKVI